MKHDPKWRDVSSLKYYSKRCVSLICVNSIFYTYTYLPRPLINFKHCISASRISFLRPTYCLTNISQFAFYYLLYSLTSAFHSLSPTIFFFLFFPQIGSFCCSIITMLIHWGIGYCIVCTIHCHQVSFLYFFIILWWTTAFSIHAFFL